MEPKLARGAAKLFAAYRHALQPRLLVLPGLLASAAAFNATLAGPEGQLGLVEQGCLLGGFLSWKVRAWAAAVALLPNALVDAWMDGWMDWLID